MRAKSQRLSLRQLLPHIRPPDRLLSSPSPPPLATLCPGARRRIMLIPVVQIGSGLTGGRLHDLVLAQIGLLLITLGQIRPRKARSCQHGLLLPQIRP